MFAVAKKVVHFVVGENREQILKNNQVQFMLAQGWLAKENVLEWDDLP